MARRQSRRVTERYAIYFAPDPESELWLRASSWLGRDAATNLAVERPQSCLNRGLIEELTAKAAGYGFHGTLVAPFSLAPGHTIENLTSELQVFCSKRAPFDVSLKPTTLGSFIALCPDKPSVELGNLHTELIKAFTRFIAPLTPADLERRSKGGRLTSRQQSNLQEWGYPYIFEDFRFHMTLTKSVSHEDRDAVLDAVEALFAELVSRPVSVDRVAIFHQASREVPFRINRYCLFG